MDLLVLTCEPNKTNGFTVVTKMYGSFKDPVHRHSSVNTITSVDSFKSTSMAAIICNDGLLKIIPVSNDMKILDVTTIR